MPAVAGGLGIVQDEAAGCPLAKRLFELVQPPSVIGHVPAAEERGIVIAGIVDHRNHDLSLHIYALVIIPSILRRIDAESAEDILRALHLHHVSGACGPYHYIFRIAQADLFLALGRQRSPDGLRRDGNHAERLEPAAAESRLEAELLQLAGEIIHRNILILGHRLPAAEFVRGQCPYPFAHQGLVTSGRFPSGLTALWSRIYGNIKQYAREREGRQPGQKLGHSIHRYRFLHEYTGFCSRFRKIFENFSTLYCKVFKSFYIFASKNTFGK